MSRTPQLESVAPDVLVSADLTSFSPSRTRSLEGNLIDNVVADERQPLLGKTKKPFYRARPLWIVPFAIVAALVRGMTLAARVEVYTQLSCNAFHKHPNYNHTAYSGVPVLSTALPSTTYHHVSLLQSIDPHLSFSPISPALESTVYYPSGTVDEDGDEDPRELPSRQCVSDPAVQKGAANLQVMMTTTMGFLSALTNGFWGNFGQRYGRTRVLALSTLGLFLTDLIFIIVSSPHAISSPLHSHARSFLLVSPVIEGLLGGWATLQSTTTAYISDCTSPGSRAHVFSRFTGVFYLGFSLGPVIGGWLIRHPIMGGDGHSVTSVFWVAITSSAINLFLMLFVYPESLSKEMQSKARKRKAPARDAEAGSGDVTGHDDAPTGRVLGFFKSFFVPLGVFLPVRVSQNDKRRDWSLTLVAISLFVFMLSMGVFQIKYLYAEHVYGWEAEQLSYYISFLGGLRAVYLLFILPFIIATFKPKAKPAQEVSATDHISTNVAPVRSNVSKEISFDLFITRASLFIDILSNFLIVVFSSASNDISHIYSSSSLMTSSISKPEALFVLSSSLSSFGSSALPAAQSLALCIIQARSQSTLTGEQQTPVKKGTTEGVGQLFGAIAVLQATGQMILGPLMFGLIYGSTVATYPPAIFVTACSILTLSFLLLLLVRPHDDSKRRSGHPRPNIIAPFADVAGPAGISKAQKKPHLRINARVGKERERGRSRVSKDLRQITVDDGGTSSHSSFTNTPPH